MSIQNEELTISQKLMDYFSSTESTFRNAVDGFCEEWNFEGTPGKKIEFMERKIIETIEELIKEKEDGRSGTVDDEYEYEFEGYHDFFFEED